MPLDPKVLNSVVRISSAADLRGTGFIVGVLSDQIPGKLWPYLITAHHVIRSQVLIEIEVPDPLTRGDLSDPVGVNDWWQPFDGIDLAIAAFPFDAPEIPRYQSFPLEYFVDEGTVAPLGSPIHYLGIFAPLDVPMCRTGSVAALEVAIDKTDEFGHRYQYVADLVDCRSYGGFSGSPCLSTTTHVIWDSAATTIPLSAVPRSATGAPLRLGNVASIARFVGMFTAHYDDENPEHAVSRYGVGLMIPSDYIRFALMADELQEARRSADKAQLQQPAESKPDAKDVALDASEPTDEPPRVEDLTRQVQAPNQKDE